MSWDGLLLVGIPLIAAAIGYLTNRIAIWMLFKPYEARHLFGVRVPLTPGLIPGRRAEIADRLGETIARHLVTETSVTERLEAPRVRQAIEEGIADRLDDWLERELGPIRSLVPDTFQEEWNRLRERVRSHVHTEIARTLRDPQTEAWIRSWIASQADRWLDRSLAEALPDRLQAELPDYAAEALARLVHEESFETRVRRFFDEAIDGVLAADAPLSDTVPTEVRDAVDAQLDELMPTVLSKLADVLEDEAIQKRLKAHLYEMADQWIADTFEEDSVWDQLKFGLMQTFVVSTDELKAKLDRAVEESAPRLAELLQQPEVQDRARQALAEGLDRLLAKRPSELPLDEDAVASLKSRLVQATVQAARSTALQEQCAELVREQLDRHSERPLRELVPTPTRQPLTDAVAEAVLEALQSEEAVEALSEGIDAWIDRMLERPLGRPGAYLGDADRARAKSWLAEQTIELLKRETPRMVQAIDVQSLVRERVNALPIADVERLILAITRRQLRAIAWFGALLGFGIGLVQVVIVVVRGGF